MWLEITHLAAWMMIVVAVKNCLQDAVHRLNHVMVKPNSNLVQRNLFQNYLTTAEGLDLLIMLVLTTITMCSMKLR